MNGIDTSPTIVDTQGLFILVVFANRWEKRTVAQILFIIKPGTITDAKLCHSSVSDVESKIRLFLPFDVSFCNRKVDNEELYR